MPLSLKPSKKTKKLAGESLVQIGQYALTVVSGPNRGLEVELLHRPLVLGSDPSCDVVLDDEAVSARHCEIAVEPDGVVLRDLASTNGTFVEEVRIREALAPVPARLRVGRTKLALKKSGTAEVAVTDQAHLGRLYGATQPMRAVFAQLLACARSSAPLLIEGETGTGKDLAAEAVHQASARKEGPCVVFDCSAVSPQLIEAELFGYEQGAFTGAARAHAGVAEQADSGTLIVDEIGELPLELQPKLLRLIEAHEVRRVGAQSSTRVDVRFIACTNRSLSAEVAAGRFREDLYYRVSALSVRMPSLREHLDDVPALVDELLRRSGSHRRFEDLTVSDRAMLLAHRWPGNVRELRNVVERLSLFPSAKAVELMRAQQPKSETPLELVELSQAREQAHDEFERRYLDAVLAKADGSISAAARISGVSRQFIQKLMRKHGMR